MTDENTRPGTGPAKRPAEKMIPEDATTTDAPTGPAAGKPAEVSVESDTALNAPTGATVERDAEPNGADRAREGGPAIGDAEHSASQATISPGARTDVEAPTAPPAEQIAPVPAGGHRADAFAWHPEHKGKSVDEVRAALAQDIAIDQRQHRLAMDGAEESEHEALASVVSLERKWGPYDFDWAEQEPEHLADRIVEFERERERRREMISWSDYRNADAGVAESHASGERVPELSTPAKGLSLLLVVLLIVVILLAVWAL